MKIAILTMATKSYRELLGDLIDSIEKKFLKNTEKDVFVFSDVDIFSEKFKSIKHYKIVHEEWPRVSLRRYEYFLGIKEELKKYDYIFYFDCDLLVVKDIEEFNFHDLFAVSHPARMLNPNMWDVETNPQSTAYLDPKVIGHYVQGSFWGGKPLQVLEMIEELTKNALLDLEKNYIAIWFDESHLNKYFFNNKDKVSQVSSGYSYPEFWNIPVEKLIIHRDKTVIKDFER